MQQLNTCRGDNSLAALTVPMVTGNGPHHSAGCCCRVLKAPSIYYRKCYFLVPRYVHCTFSPRKVSQSVQVELVQGGGVANRGPDSWDIWAPGWSCSHQHSDWIGEKEIPGITLNLLPFSSFLALLRVNPRGLVSKEAFEGEGP